MQGHNLIVWDKKTLLQMKEGNQAAVAQCYEQLSPMIYTAIYKICRNKDVANDLLHDTFIDALDHLGQVTEEQFFPGWLKKIAFNNTFNYLRRQNIFSQVVEKITLLTDSQHDFTSQIEDQNQLELLLTKVSKQHRLILWLFIVEQYTHEEIAELTHRTVSFSKSVVYRATKKLNGFATKVEQETDNAY